jgi:hypothetical protein
MSSGSCLTVVRSTEDRRAIGASSKPVTDTSAGTLTPFLRMVAGGLAGLALIRRINQAQFEAAAPALGAVSAVLLLVS